MRFIKTFLVLAFALLSLVSFAEEQGAGTIDPTFNPDFGVGAGSAPLDVAFQDDGKAILVGGLGHWPGIVRLNANGTVDSTFTFPQAVSGDVGARRVRVQSDGKVLLALQSVTLGGDTRQGLVRLNKDGTLDLPFNPMQALTTPDGSAPVIYDLVLQTDGRIIAMGNLQYTINGVVYTRLARFKADGTLDSTFRPQLDGIVGPVDAVAMAPDGNLVVTYGKLAQNSFSYVVVRLLADGSVDPKFTRGNGSGPTTFNPLAGESSVRIGALAVDSEGRVIAGGAFDKFDGASAPGIIRFQANGAIDPQFVTAGFHSVRQTPGQPQTNVIGPIYQILPLDGKILVTGSFNHYGDADGPAKSGFARLLTDGTLDTDFAPPTFTHTIANDFTAVAVRPGTDQFLCYGALRAADDLPIPGVAQISATGVLDTSFRTNLMRGMDGPPQVAVALPDGKVLAAGFFYQINGETRPGIVRLKKDGSVDPTFNAGFVGSQGVELFPANVSSFAVQNDGRIVIAGTFTSVAGAPRKGLARLNEDGSLDPSFDVHEGFAYGVAPGTINQIALWQDPANPNAPEKVVVVGSFTDFLVYGVDENGIPFSRNVPRESIARLNSDGSLDTGFDPGSGFTDPNTPHAIAIAVVVQPDGRIVATSNASRYHGSAVGRVVRIQADGALDSTFNSSTATADSAPQALALQGDGKVLYAGFFNALPDGAKALLRRLKSDGANDASFSSSSGFDDVFGAEVTSIHLQQDGRILAAGKFRQYQGVDRPGMVRIKQDGSIDSSFTSEFIGSEHRVFDTAVQADENIVAVGPFHLYGSAIRQFAVRVFGAAGPVQEDLTISGAAVSSSDPSGLTARPGDVLTYTYSYRNSGTEAVTGIQITSSLPAGTSLKTLLNRGRLVTRKVGGRPVKQLLWVLPRLEAGAKGTVSFSVLLPRSARIDSEIDNVGFAIFGERNGAPLPIVTGVGLHTQVKPLVTVTTTSPTAQVGPGGLITYTFTVQNDGGAMVRDIQLAYTLPTGTGFVGAYFLNASGGETNPPVAGPKKLGNPVVDTDTGTVRWYFGNIPARTSHQVKLTVRVWYDAPLNKPVPGGELSATYRDSANKLLATPNVLPAPIAASGQLPATAPFIGISSSILDAAVSTDDKYGEIATAVAGDKITYRLNYYNLGDAPAEGAFVQVHIPEGAALLQSTLRVNGRLPVRDTVTLTDKGRLLRIRLGDIPAPFVGEITYQVKVHTRAQGGVALNGFLRSSGTYIGSTALGTTPHGFPDPLLVKVVAPVTFTCWTEASAPQGAVGEVVSHYIHFRNNGGIPAKNAEIVNPIPAGTKYRGAALLDPALQDHGVSWNGRTVAAPSTSTIGDIRFAMGSIAPKEEVVVRVDLEVLPAARNLAVPTIQNVATLRFGSSRTASRAPGTFSLASVPSVTIDSAFTREITRFYDPTVPRFFIGAMGPAAVKKGQEFWYHGFYGNLSDTDGTATVHLNIPPNLAKMTLVGTSADKTSPGNYSADNDEQGNLVITARVPAHQVILYHIRCTALAAAGEVIVSRGHSVSGPGISTVYTGVPLYTYVYPADSDFNANAAAASIAELQLQGAGSNIAGGLGEESIRSSLSQINARTLTTAIAGADYVSLKNGCYLIPLGGGQIIAGAPGIVANDGATIVANDGATLITAQSANIVANDGATLVAGGAGNISFSNLAGFSGAQTATALLQNPVGIVSGGAGNLLNLGGLNLFGGISGSALISNVNGQVAALNYFQLSAASIVSGGAGNIVSGGAGNIVSGGAGNIIAGGAGNILAVGGGALINQDGSSIRSNDSATIITLSPNSLTTGASGNVIGQDGSSLIGQDGSN